MHFFQPRNQREPRRRSLLLKREDGAAPVSVVKSLATANVIVVAMTLGYLWVREPVISVRELATVALISMVFATPITILAHYSSGYVNRRTAHRPRIVRMLWLVLAWITSGCLGTSIAYLILAAAGINMPLSSNMWSIALLSNSAIAIVIGTFVLLFEATGARLRQRSRYNSQGELLAAELEAARNVQESLLPGEEMRVHGYDISSATAPAVEIGGDYFDYLSFSDGSKGIIVADAAGKGIPAALVMAKFQGMAQALSIHVSDPTEFFVGLNDALRVRLNRRNFITVGMLTIDFDDCMTFYRAGHSPLLMYTAATQTTQFCRPQGMALGLTHGAAMSQSIEPYHFQMERGDVVVLYSDGLNEAVNPAGEEYGDERLALAVKSVTPNGSSASAIRVAILADVATFVADAHPHDDMTLVVVRRV